MDHSSISGEPPEAPVDPEPSAAGPLSTGFVLTSVALLVVVGGGALARGNDDWLLLVLPSALVLLVGILKLGEGIHGLVRAYERSLRRR